MGRKSLGPGWFLITFILIIRWCYSYHFYVTEATGNHFEKEFRQFQNGDESHSLKNRMSKAEFKIQQGEEIIALKTTVDESKEVINQLSERIENLGDWFQCKPDFNEQAVVLYQ